MNAHKRGILLIIMLPLAGGYSSLAGMLQRNLSLIAGPFVSPLKEERGCFLSEEPSKIEFKLSDEEHTFLQQLKASEELSIIFSQVRELVAQVEKVCIPWKALELLDPNECTIAVVLEKSQQILSTIPSCSNLHTIIKNIPEETHFAALPAVLMNEILFYTQADDVIVSLGEIIKIIYTHLVIQFESCTSVNKDALGDEAYDLLCDCKKQEQDLMCVISQKCGLHVDKLRNEKGFWRKMLEKMPPHHYFFVFCNSVSKRLELLNKYLNVYEKATAKSFVAMASMI